MSKTILAGKLSASTDSWQLITGNHLVSVDVLTFNLFADPVLSEGNDVTILGEIAVPSSSTERKLVAEKIIDHDMIRVRAFDISRSPHSGSDIENRLLAERELLSA